MRILQRRSWEIEAIKKIKISFSESEAADRRVTPMSGVHLGNKELGFGFLLLVSFSLHQQQQISSG